MQIKILSYDKEVMIKSVYLNRYFNKLMTKFVKDLPISRSEISNILYHLRAFKYSPSNSIIKPLDKCIIYDDNYDKNGGTKIKIYFHHKDDRFGVRKSEFSFPICEDSEDSENDETDYSIDYRAINVSNHWYKPFNNLDLFSKYLIYKLRFYSYNYFNDKHQNIKDDDFIKNKLLKELDEKYQSVVKNDEKYQSVVKNDELISPSFNEYLLLQKIRYEQGYCNWTKSEKSQDKSKSQEKSGNKLTDEFDMVNNMKEIRKRDSFHYEKINHKLYKDLRNVIKNYNIDDCVKSLYY